ncbi:MAG: AraC family transcriptional regulator [Dokdonella sp.]|uniref:AraC family transcriptional regulator n=1 Tax=Dokdonella sp. TaxID=2291710 RepID=UPI003263D060
MGALSWIFTLLALNGAVMAVLLAVARINRIANGFLAALVGLISLRLAIYVLGFAGVYDDHPWITFAPLDASLAFGALLWLYVESLTRGLPPERWRLHLLPAGVQLAYSAAAFALPLDVKLRWFRGPHLDWIEPIGFIAVLGSCAAYLALCWRRQRAYQSWLDDTFANRERWRLAWLTAILGAFAVTLAFATTAAVINAFSVPVDYFGRTPVILASSLLAYLLGLLGWRHATVVLPPQPLTHALADAPDPRRSRPAAIFPAWAMRVETEGWWREEGLTLSQVAQRLGTSERTLSRGLSEGAGRNFNEFINGLRVEAVMRAISGGARDDLLSLAFDYGFSSKASFNRAFLRYTGTTPSLWRASAPQISPTGTSGAT